MRVIQLENVYKEYLLGEQRVHALIDVTLSFDDGAFAAIAGPSGSGKSTILNLIGCIDSPTKGKVLVDGEDVSGKTPDQLSDLRSRTIGFIFQTFNLFPVLSAAENVEYPLLHRRDISASERRERVERFLGIVGLSNFSRHRPNQLSGGQRQRVAIARALATHPKIILADEPTANLDHKTGEGILRLMKEINRRDRTTFIFSTHDSRVMAMADRLVHIEDGRLCQPPGEAAWIPAGAPAPTSGDAGMRERITGKALAPAAAAVRERIKRFLYIENHDAYMAAPWHLDMSDDVWTVNPCSTTISDPAEYIRQQLDGQCAFHRAANAFVLVARRRGIQVIGWP